MSELKTPRTDALVNDGSSWAMIVSHGRQLETENAELKAENIRITKLRDHDFEELAELAELKRQIADGELIPSKVAESYLSELSEGNVSEMTLGIKEFAKREAGAK